MNGAAHRIPMAGPGAELATAINRIVRLAHAAGGFIAFHAGPLVCARICFNEVDEIHSARLRIFQLRNQLVGMANTMNPLLVSLGGGCKGITAQVRHTETLGLHLEIDLFVDVPIRSDDHFIEVMIARMTPVIERLTHGRRSAASVTDITDRQLLCAQITLDERCLDISRQRADALAGRIVDLYKFMLATPLHMNAHNALILSAANAALDGAGIPGSDPRPSWKARTDRDAALSIWYRDHRGRLCGRIALPAVAAPSDSDFDEAAVPSAAGTSIAAQHVNHAAAAIGLAQSLASMHAHASAGITCTDVSQHAHDLALIVGARDAEADLLAQHMASARDVRCDHAIKLLDALRRQ